MYNTGKPICEYFNHESNKTAERVEAEFGHQVNLCIKLINAQFQILERASWTFAQTHFSGRGVAEPALISSLHKGMFLFYSTINLTKRGFYGPGNALLRSIFESLVIAKYVSVSPSTSVFDSWIDGEQIHLTNHVFNRIKSPKIPELMILWKSLHKSTHATVFSQQVYLEYSEIKTAIAVTLSIIQLLLCMNQHLLGTHFLTSSTIRYTQMYGDAEEFKQVRHDARELTKELREGFTKFGRQIVREYCASWKLKGKPGHPRSLSRI